MPLDWTNYDDDSGAEAVPLLLSVRSQSLVLAALEFITERYAWEEIDDSTWEDIDNAIGEAYEEIMEVHTTIPAMMDAVHETLQRNTDQAITANTITPLSWNDRISSLGQFMWDISDPTIIRLNEDGVYHISFTVFFPSTAAVQNKAVILFINATEIYRSNITILTLASVVGGIDLQLNAGDEIVIKVFCPVAVSIQGDSLGLTTVSVARGVRLL